MGRRAYKRGSLEVVTPRSMTDHHLGSARTHEDSLHSSRVSDDRSLEPLQADLDAEVNRFNVCRTLIEKYEQVA